jgi:hypothetical protein
VFSRRFRKVGPNFFLLEAQLALPHDQIFVVHPDLLMEILHKYDPEWRFLCVAHRSAGATQEAHQLLFGVSLLDSTDHRLANSTSIRVTQPVRLREA